MKNVTKWIFAAAVMLSVTAGCGVDAFDGSEIVCESSSLTGRTYLMGVFDDKGVYDLVVHGTVSTTTITIPTSGTQQDSFFCVEVPPGCNNTVELSVRGGMIPAHVFRKSGAGELKELTVRKSPFGGVVGPLDTVCDSDQSVCATPPNCMR